MRDIQKLYENYMKIKLNSGDDLLLKKTLELCSITNYKSKIINFYKL